MRGKIVNKLVATAATVIAFAALSPAKTATVGGQGHHSCGEYTRAAEDEQKVRPSKADPSALYSNEYVRYADYLMGFLAGENMADQANGQDGNVGFSQNTIGMMAWLDNYCRRNPTDAFIRALIMLRGELVEKHR
jgi:hypothetical protein